VRRESRVSSRRTRGKGESPDSQTDIFETCGPGIIFDKGLSLERRMGRTKKREKSN